MPRIKLEFISFLVVFILKYDTIVITKDMKRAVTFIRIILQYNEYSFYSYLFFIMRRIFYYES